MSDKFNFYTAASLVQAVEGVASTLDIKNEEIKNRFRDLGESFKDSGYDKYATEMAEADTAFNEVIAQLHDISKNISDYAVRLQEASK